MHLCCGVDSNFGPYPTSNQVLPQRRNYPAWHKAVMEIPPEYVIQIKFRLMFYAHKIEEREKLSESVAAQALRERFSIQATQRKDHK